MVHFDRDAYLARVNKQAPKSKTFCYLVRAFWVGGLICAVGQLVGDLGDMLFQFTNDERSSFAASVMVFLGAFLTGIGVYDKIGAYAGAGSVVPITGFANSVVAPAMEYKPEGFVMGVAAKMFTLAGPVLVYGIGSSILVGVIYCILGA